MFLEGELGKVMKKKEGVGRKGESGGVASKVRWFRFLFPICMLLVVE